MTTSQKNNVPALRFSEFSGDWDNSALAEVSKYQKGYAFKSSDYSDVGIRIIRVSDLGADRIKHNNNKVFIETEKAINYERWKLEVGNIIITTVGSKPDLLESAVGRGIYVDREHEGLLN